MKWWRVTGTVTVSAEVWVRAKSPTLAIERARSMEPALAPYGIDRSGVDPTEQAVIEDADGAFVPTFAEVGDPPDGFGEEE